MLYRFEIYFAQQDTQGGVYQMLSPWFLHKQLRQFNELPDDYIEHSNPILFFFTEAGMEQYACELRKLFTDEDLMAYMQSSTYTLKGLKIDDSMLDRLLIESPDCVIGQDAYQMALDYEVIACSFNLNELIPILTVEDWDEFTA